MHWLSWLIGFATYSAFAYWVVCRDGADHIEGWKSFFLISGFAPAWTPDGIRLYVMISWFLALVGFVIGLFHPALVAQS